MSQSSFKDLSEALTSCLDQLADEVDALQEAGATGKDIKPFMGEISSTATTIRAIWRKMRKIAVDGEPIPKELEF